MRDQRAVAVLSVSLLVHGVPNEALGGLRASTGADGLNRQVCVDIPWADSGGASCSGYELGDLCTESGGYGSGWSAGTFADFAADGYDASAACCACGGGSSTQAAEPEPGEPGGGAAPAAELLASGALGGGWRSRALESLGLEALFNQTDSNGDGVITRAELRDVLGKVDVGHGVESEGLQTKIFVGIKSGAGPVEKERRKQWRDSPCRQYYADNNVEYRFFVGRPYESGHHLDGHNQGGRDTDWERLAGAEILEESEESKDIVMVPMRDQYMALPDKVFSIYDYAVGHFPDVRYLGEQDVEYCMDVAVVRGLIHRWHKGVSPKHVRKASQPKECLDSGRSADCAVLYMGCYMFSGTEYPSMTGPTGQHVPYMNGWFVLMSRTLVEVIVGPERTRSVLNGVNGTVAEDNAVGRWVNNAREARNLHVSYVAKGMIKEVDKMDQPLLLR